jgi:hypothetical protein
MEAGRCNVREYGVACTTVSEERLPLPLEVWRIVDSDLDTSALAFLLRNKIQGSGGTWKAVVPWGDAAPSEARATPEMTEVKTFIIGEILTKPL